MMDVMGLAQLQTPQERVVRVGRAVATFALPFGAAAFLGTFGTTFSLNLQHPSIRLHFHFCLPEPQGHTEVDMPLLHFLVSV